jgi:hypothetical protein
MQEPALSVSFASRTSASGRLRNSGKKLTGRRPTAAFREAQLAGGATTPPKPRAPFLAHWQAEEQRHFRLEEELLLPAYATHVQLEHPAVIGTLLDPMLIRRDAERLAATPSLELLHELGARVADHVQLEEHKLFALIEATIPDAEL